MMRNPRHLRLPSGQASDELDFEADHLLVVVSDVEMGPGGSTDDFPQTEFLGELLLGYNEPAYAGMAVTIVFNGDTFDLLKTALEGEYPARITSAVALAKLERIVSAHSIFFDQLGQFLAFADAPRRIVFVAGNHDLELLFVEVQARLKDRIGCSSSIEFAGHGYTIGDVAIEHGSQTDPLFAVDPQIPFLDVDGERVLNIPWGTLALLEVALPLTHEALHALDRLRPRRQILDRLPEVRELLTQSYWHYWTHDYWRGVFSRSDVLHRVSWTMAKEVVYRFVTGDPELAATDARALLRRPGPTKTYAVGHQHNPAYWGLEDRVVLQTGCFRNEYLFDEDGDHRLLPKIFAEVFLADGHTMAAHLVHVDGPEPQRRSVPRKLDEVLPAVRRLLKQLGNRAPTRPIAAT